MTTCINDRHCAVLCCVHGHNRISYDAGRRCKQSYLEREARSKTQEVRDMMYGVCTGMSLTEYGV